MGGLDNYILKKKKSLSKSPPHGFRNVRVSAFEEANLNARIDAVSPPPFSSSSSNLLTMLN